MSVSIKNGSLVPVRLQSGKIIPCSLSTVGHEMKAGGVIVDLNGDPIAPTRLSVCRTTGGCASKHLEVIDAGPQYRVAFDPNAQYAHHVMVHKA